jgi:hypothetical protein
MQNGKDSNHAYARPPAVRGRSVSESRTEAPDDRYSGSKSGKLLSPGQGGGLKAYLARVISFFLSYILRRHVVLLLFPVIWISGMLLYMGTIADERPAATGAAPGFVYRSPEIFERLWPEMEGVNGSRGASLGVCNPVPLLSVTCACPFCQLQFKRHQSMLKL